MAHTKKMGLSTATLLGINSMIGAGIFTTPALLAHTVGPVALCTYIFVIFAVGCMGWSFARLAQRFPEEGSFYLYTKQWAGHRVGMIAAWMYVVGILTAMGLLAERAGTYLQDYTPDSSVSLLSIGVLVGLVALNLISARIAQASQYLAICCTVFPLLTITVLCMVHGSWDNLTPFAPFGWMPALLASKDVIFGFFGFEGIPGIFPLVEDAKKNVPRALMIAIGVVSTVYLLFIASIFFAIPAPLFATPGTPLSHPLRELFPAYPWLVGMVHLSMTLSFMSVLNAVIYYVSTLVQSLTKKMKMPLSRHMAIVCVGGFILAANLSLKTLNQFFAAVSVCILFSFLSSFITLLTIKAERTLPAVVACATSAIIFCSAIMSLFGMWA
jgi:basic amino acid/polyamine antiporter, APA family